MSDKEKTPEELRADANKSMSLERALWSACNILPINNIDIASKRLALEVWILQQELGRKRTDGNWKV